MHSRRSILTAVLQIKENFASTDPVAWHLSVQHEDHLPMLCTAVSASSDPLAKGSCTLLYRAALVHHGLYADAHVDAADSAAPLYSLYYARAQACV